MRGEEIGKALAYAMGDLRDWPKRCAWCGSQRLVEDHERQRLHCEECARQTSNEVAYQYRLDRARAEVTGQPRRFREVEPYTSPTHDPKADAEKSRAVQGTS